MPREVLLRISLGAALVIATAACGAGETAQGSVHPGSAGADAPKVVMSDDVFQPGAVQLTAGVPVTIEVRNDGKNNHNFTIDSLNTSTGPMKTGDVVAVTFTPAKGTAEFHCTFHQG